MPSFFPHAPLWLRAVPFFLSALLFLSAFFAIFSPLPILLLGLSGEDRILRRSWAWTACFSNAALVLALGGETSLATYTVFVLALSLGLMELLARGRKPDDAAAATLGLMTLTGIGVVLFYSQVHHIHPWSEVRNAVSEFVDYWVKTVATESPGLKHPPEDAADLQLWKQGLMIELPSAIAIMGLIFVWANLVTLLRLNPRGLRSRLGIRNDFFQTWKTPEWLVWPTLLTGATLLLDFGPVSDVGRNVFKLLMTVYAFQGLSILSFFFGHWKVRRVLTFIGYSAAVLLMMPLLLSLGFFDLWFDFRSKFRQS